MVLSTALYYVETGDTSCCKHFASKAVAVLFLIHPPLLEDIISSEYCVFSYHTHHLAPPIFMQASTPLPPPNHTPFTHLYPFAFPHAISPPTERNLGSCVFPLSTPRQFLLAVLTSLSMMGCSCCLLAVVSAFSTCSFSEWLTSQSLHKQLLLQVSMRLCIEWHVKLL